jgi:hypothetical protein
MSVFFLDKLTDIYRHFQTFPDIYRHLPKTRTKSKRTLTDTYRHSQTFADIRRHSQTYADKYVPSTPHRPSSTPHVPAALAVVPTCPAPDLGSTKWPRAVRRHRLRLSVASASSGHLQYLLSTFPGARFSAVFVLYSSINTRQTPGK